MGRFDNKVVLVTGAGSGMGAAFAKAFAAEGAKVVACDISEENVKKVSEELGENVVAVKTDVAKAEDWAKAIEVAHEKFGEVTVLVNSAGIADLTPLEFISEEAFRRSIEVNLMSNFYGIRSVIPDMKNANWGRIVNIGSIATIAASGDAPAYATSKHGVGGLTKAAAHGLAKYNILVNAVLPGTIDTPMMNGVKEMGPEAVAYICNSIPLKRMAKPEEVASLVLYLASEENNYVDGTEIVIDGGMRA